MNRLRRLSVLVAGLAVLSGASGCGPHADRTAEQLYPEYCARCHGPSGKGDPRNVPLYPNLDLTRSKLIGKDAHFLVYRRIAQGYGPMPGFAHRLSTDEISALTDYSLKLNPAYRK